MKANVWTEKPSVESEFYELFAASSILVACKETSNERKSRDILNCLFYCIHQPHSLEIDGMFWRLKVESTGVSMIAHTLSPSLVTSRTL